MSETLVYIAGPISGHPEIPLEEKKARFYWAEEHLEKLGYQPIVPMDIPVDSCPGECNPEGHIGQEGVPTHGWGCFMRHDLRVLIECDAIALLPGWMLSRGAKLEAEIAEACGMKVIFLDEVGMPVAGNATFK